MTSLFKASVAFALAAGLMGCATSTSTVNAEPAAAESAEAEPAPPPKTDPAALQALDRMAAYLGTLKSFEIVASTEKDVVMPDGQKFQVNGVNTYKVRRPDRAWIEIATDRKTRQLIYDGKNFSIWAPQNKMYAQTDAPPTIGELLTEIDERFEIETPLADLFYWGTDRVNASNIESAVHVGASRINGRETDQYAFRGKEVDFQIWIQRGNQPLPLKIVITSWQEDDSPQYSAELTWKTNVSWPEKTFVFTPPKGAGRIPLSEVPAAEAGADAATPTQ